MLIVTYFGSVIDELAVHKTPTVLYEKRWKEPQEPSLKKQDPFTYIVVEAVDFTAAKSEGQSNWM